jgi:hypothetical protein
LDTDDAVDSVHTAFQRVKAEVYHQVLGIIFEKARKASHTGKVWKFGDGQTRRGYPDLLIKLLDMQEAWAICACQSGQANFPCVKCLVPKTCQHELGAKFEPCTKENMGKVYKDVHAEHRVTYKEKLLVGAGLHNVKVSLAIALHIASAVLDTYSDIVLSDI